MNEPMSIRRRELFDTWRDTAEAITAVIPDMSVSICDSGEASIYPAIISDITGAHFDIAPDTFKWIQRSNNVFYAWHYGGSSVVENVEALGEAWGIPTFGTEVGCTEFESAAGLNVSHLYWHCERLLGPASVGFLRWPGSAETSDW